ncbi:uncharacterized protein CANTADRAFT_22610 [Suhomyces tanzawaensis NRRL Y-17324]|uniref:FAD-binding FR-type domain-containing protein n=1 Tax=Suhomyces tanzawaensis NRRL Y-17324 TaxID=984487 RepID=A0A1E4SGJ5_9ASCO|nr:uncharacterized protein CANTADRAFT_22610 [Suhomyces tanzawaensis NRRL Y-17324]ODV78637.1 hypothetical protein CANTADRAFT_22610 [Suhomyces tanzawaensis NRRL Y-17324]
MLSRLRPITFRSPARVALRFNSKKSDPNHENSDKSVSQAKEEGLSEFKFKQKTSSSAPAPMEGNGVDKLLKKSNKPYIPKIKHDRLSFEYPGLPNQDKFNATAEKPKIIGRWTRYVPKIITAIVVLWGAYTVKVWFYAPEKGADSKELLDPNGFHKFVVTHKEEIDEDHYLIELHPKFNHWQYSYYNNYEKKSIWNGDRIWSVDVKQPDIMVVRAYTPLPLYFLKSEYTRSGERKPLLKVVNNDGEDYDKQGVMCLYIKKYGDGEVSKYVTNKEVGDEIELRGPNIEYKFPYHPLKQYHERPIFRDLPSKVEPESLVEKVKKINKIPDFDNLTFYAAGTGIAPALQILLSRNPYRGYVTIHYSAQKQGELKPLERFMYFLEKLDRVEVKTHYDTEPKTRLSSKDITEASPTKYLSPLRIEKSELSPEEALKLRMSVLDGKDSDSKNETELTELSKEVVPRFENALQQAMVTSQQVKAPSALAIVCGPDGYVDFVAGPKNRATNEQGEVLGLMKGKGWDNTNTFKL